MGLRRVTVAICALVVLSGCSSVVAGSGGGSDSSVPTRSGPPSQSSSGDFAPPPGPIGSSAAGASSGGPTRNGGSSTRAGDSGSGTPALGADLVAFVQAGKPAASSEYAYTREQSNGPKVASYGSERYLVTPTKNIACFLDKQVTCNIRERTYADPPKRECHGINFASDYVEVIGGSVYRGLCLGGLPYSPYGNVLPYGSTLRVGDYACRSDMNFMACVDIATRRGFILSRTILRAG